MCFGWLKKLIWGEFFKSDLSTDLDYTFTDLSNTKITDKSLNEDNPRILDATLSKNAELGGEDAVYVWDIEHLPDALFEWMDENNLSKEGLTHLMLVPDEEYSILKLDIGLGVDICKSEDYYVGKSGYIARLYYNSGWLRRG
jgi:hypothetical protein